MLPAPSRLVRWAHWSPLTQAALLGAIAVRFPSQTLKWDDKKMRFSNHAEANAFIAPPYREGWKL